MTHDRTSPEARAQVAREGEVTLRALGYPNAFLRDRLEFLDSAYEWRRLFAEVLGTFFLVAAAAGSTMVNARFGGVPEPAQVVVPGLMVGAIILSIGSVSGAHLNPVVSLAFALRGDFPWRRVPTYVVAQCTGGALAMLVLIALVGHQGSAGMTLPASSVATSTAMWWEALLTLGLVTTILGTASGAQNVGALSAVAVAAYIALAGLWGAPVSGASMNPARSLAPDLVLNDWSAWWAYAAGPVVGALVAVVAAWALRGTGGGVHGRSAAQGTLGLLWRPGRVDYRVGDESEGPSDRGAASGNSSQRQPPS